MGQKTVRFSDLSGELITDDEAPARIVVAEHPGLPDGPVEIEALTAEATDIANAGGRAALVDLYFPGDDRPRRVVLDAAEFDKLATDKPMSEILAAARPARRTSRSAAAGGTREDRVNYGTLEHAGKPHKGKTTEVESGWYASIWTRSTSGWPRRTCARSAPATPSMWKGTACRGSPRSAAPRVGSRPHAPATRPDRVRRTGEVPGREVREKL